MYGLTEENIDDFTISDRRRLIFCLHRLMEDCDPVSIIFNEGRDNILTMLLHVNEEQDTLILDWGSSEEVNNRFLTSERSFIVAMPHGIRNQFLAEKPRKVTYKKRPAFAVQLPEKYIRLQRREYFRLVLPIRQRPTCSFSLINGSTFASAVLDIGLGGAAIEVDSAKTPGNVGEIISGVMIDLGEFGELKTNLNIRYINKTTREIRQTSRVGCKFEKLTSAHEHLLQKFITHLQREERARLGI